MRHQIHSLAYEKINKDKIKDIIIFLKKYKNKQAIAFIRLLGEELKKIHIAEKSATDSLTRYLSAWVDLKENKKIKYLSIYFDALISKRSINQQYKASVKNGCFDIELPYFSSYRIGAEKIIKNLAIKFAKLKNQEIVFCEGWDSRTNETHYGIAYPNGIVEFRREDV